MTTRCSITVSLLVTVLGCGALQAEVIDVSPSGFTVNSMLEIAASTDRVYQVLVQHVGAWWDGSHTFSGKSANLSMEASPNGCFCEKLGSDGGVRHATVVFAQPGKLLRLSGGIGPLQEKAVVGTMTFALHATDRGTRLELTYAVAGYLPEGLAQWAAPVDSVLLQQIERLRRYVETGKPGVE